MTRRPFLLPTITFLGCWLILAATSPGIPIVWDEGEYIRRAGFVVEWLRLVFSGSAASIGAFSAASIKAHWLFIDFSEGHPAWFIYPIGFGRLLFERWVDPLTAARLGPVTVFSLACACVAARARKEWGLTAAIVAPVALITFPRIFSEAHFATQDGQLTAWWLMLWAADTPPVLRSGTAMRTGVVLGLVTATKFTGWLAWMPVIVSRIVPTRASIRSLALVIVVAGGVFCAVNPPLWHHPVDGLLSHFHRSLDRAHTFSIPILFLGRVYDMQHPLPWYNTIAWLLLVTPVPTLVLGAFGLFQGMTTMRTRASVTLVLHWATLMVVRALPGAPPHDGIRLFLPSFGLWCVFAGIGAQRIEELSRRSFTRWRLLVVRALLIASLGAGCVNLVRYYPQTLSHYSALAGGLRGAARLGMEPAYWWDGLDNDVLTWLNEHTDPPGAVAFSPVSNMTELHAWRRLRPRDVDPTREPFTWYVLQNRPGKFTDRDRALVRGAQPAYVKYAGRRSEGSAVPSDLNVPLIMIYSYDQYGRAR